MVDFRDWVKDRGWLMVDERMLQDIALRVFREVDDGCCKVLGLIGGGKKK